MPALLSCLTTNYGRFGGRAAIERVRDAGLSHIELPIRTEGIASRQGDEPLVTTESTLSDLREVDRLLAAHGVQVSSCDCFAGNPLDPQNLATILRKLDLATHFGVPLIITDAGAAETPEELAQLYQHLRQLGDYAAARGVTVCFETHRGVCQDHRKMLLLMHELQHPHLRLNFDTGNIFYYNECLHVEVALAKACPFVRHVHLKDSTGEYQHRCFPALGQGGAVDFLRVYQIMRDRGFTGPFSIEIEGVPGEPELSLDELHQRVVSSVRYLKSLGYLD